jgi:hypothetical protein
MPTKLEDIALELASGYPNQDISKVATEFAEILRIALPALTGKAGAARQQGSGSVEEAWKVIRGEAEAIFQAALGRVERMKVVYVTSKFMNNKAIGTMITQAALAAGEEV